MTDTSPSVPPYPRTTVQAPPAGYARHPHPEPRSYPLIQRTWDFEAWRPIVGLILVLAGMLLVAPLVLMPVLAIGIAVQGGGDFSTQFSDALNQTRLTPASMLYLNLTLASLIVITWLVNRFLHRLRLRWLFSVRPGVRWKFFWICMGLAIVAMVAQLLVATALPVDQGMSDFHPRHLTGELVALGIVILLTTPLQAMGEEFAFRGYAMQAFGSFTHWFAELTGARGRTARLIAETVAVLLTATVFALAHGVQNAPLFLDRFLFGLMAGFVVVRTGGLEAGIAMHIWNNLFAFGFGILFGNVQQMLTETHVSWWNLPLTLTQNGVYLVLVLVVARVMRLDNKSHPEVATSG